MDADEGFVDTIPYSLTWDIKELEPFEVDTDFIFICDLHLAAGIDPISGGMHPREEFLHDQVFSRWLEHCVNQAAAGGRQAVLVLLGDTVDLLHVRPLEGRSGSPEAAASKLDRIASGHPVFFAGAAHLFVEERLDCDPARQS